MFRKMRRTKQALSQEECIQILNSTTHGVLAVSGDDGYPYAVPVSHTYEDGKLYFHCAVEGHKLDAIARSDKVSFCTVAQDEVQPAEFATLYRSVILFGRARVVTDDAARRRALESLVLKFSPGFVEEGQREIEKDWARTCVVEISIEHMTGKCAKALASAGE